MRHAAVVVAVLLAVALSGCNLLGGGSDVGIDRTVSPAAVPEPSAPNTPTPPSRRCLAPRPATPDPASASPPAESVALPRDGEAINGSALVDLHASALADHRFHLRIEPDTEVRAMAGAVAFSYEGTALDVGSTWAYAVGGTLYTVANERSIEENRGQVRVLQRPYGSSSDRRARYVRVLTGSQWLSEHVAPYDYTVADTRTWNGTRVRVLRSVDADGGNRTSDEGDGNRTGDAERANRTATENPNSTAVRTTLYVDRRGVVRLVRQVGQSEYVISSSSPPYDWGTRRFVVPSVGEASVSRPSAFCVEETRRAILATPGENNGPYGERVPYPFAVVDTDANETTPRATPERVTTATPTPTRTATVPAGSPTPTQNRTTTVPTATP